MLLSLRLLRPKSDGFLSRTFTLHVCRGGRQQQRSENKQKIIIENWTGFYKQNSQYVFVPVHRLDILWKSSCPLGIYRFCCCVNVGKRRSLTCWLFIQCRFVDLWRKGRLRASRLECTKKRTVKNEISYKSYFFFIVIFSSGLFVILQAENINNIINVL